MNQIFNTRFDAPEIAATIFDEALMIHENLYGWDRLANGFNNMANQAHFHKPSLAVALRALRSQGMTAQDSRTLDTLLFEFLTPHLDKTAEDRKLRPLARHWSISHHLGVKTTPDILNDREMCHAWHKEFAELLKIKMRGNSNLFQKRFSKRRSIGIPIRLTTTV